MELLARRLPDLASVAVLVRVRVAESAKAKVPGLAPAKAAAMAEVRSALAAVSVRRRLCRASNLNIPKKREKPAFKALWFWKPLSRETELSIFCESFAALDSAWMRMRFKL